MRLRIILLLTCFCLAPLTSRAAAIHDAAKKGDVAAIVAALDAGADVNEREHMATPLYYAVKRGHFAAAKLLIERGADVNAPMEYWGEPLMVAAVQGRVDLMSLLLAHGAIPDSTVNGETALHAATLIGCLACVKALVEAGADVNFATANYFKRTPIHIARFFGYAEVADYLMAHGVILPRPPPISAKLAAADVEKGRMYFNDNCTFCHFAEPHKGRKHGPNLWDVVGRDKASLPDAAYSKILRAWDGVWSY